MGLDQYAFAREINPDEAEPVDIDVAYWRKHNRLQGWMENLYRDKNPDDNSEFNCQEVEITLEDLDRLESDIKEKSLPPTEGFFFGDDSYGWNDQEGIIKYDLDFIRNARGYVMSGYKIYYSSWW